MNFFCQAEDGIRDAQESRGLGEVYKRQAYRYGGEEFSVILPATKGEQGIVTAERVRIALKNEIFKPRPDKDIRVTVSIGLAQHARNEEMMDFLRRADRNLYKAKASGKNQVCFSQQP